MKPIEAGCLALIIKSHHPEYVGKVVRVIRFLGKVPGFVSNRRWETDTYMVSMFGTIANHKKESDLLRIDGLDPSELTSTDHECTISSH